MIVEWKRLFNEPFSNQSFPVANSFSPLNREIRDFGQVGTRNFMPGQVLIRFHRRSPIRNLKEGDMVRIISASLGRTTRKEGGIGIANRSRRMGWAVYGGSFLRRNLLMRGYSCLRLFRDLPNPSQLIQNLRCEGSFI